MSLPNRGLVAFRRLTRARKKLFANDAYALINSRMELRNEFLKNRSAGGEELEELLRGVDEVEDMMLHGILQGKINDDTNTVEIKVQNEHTTAAGDDVQNGTVEITKTTTK